MVGVVSLVRLQSLNHEFFAKILLHQQISLMFVSIVINVDTNNLVHVCIII
jgi:hypothetical protein